MTTPILRHLMPAMARESGVETLRAGAGALCGLAICAVLTSLAPGGLSLYLFAPLGATAVLVFAVPNSPLAQPWSAVMGNMVSALVAVAVLSLLPLAYAPAVAVAGAVAAMMVARALHPPGGAVALLAVLNADRTLEAGFWFVLSPVGLCTAALVAVAVVYDRATGRVYPFRQTPAGPQAEAAPRLGLSKEELEDLLLRFHQSANLGAVDLGRLLAAAEREAAQHRFDAITCGDIASEALISVRPDTPVRDIAALFQTHAIKSLPVIDKDGTFAGIVQQVDLMQCLSPTGRVLSRTGRMAARHVMRAPANVVAHDMPVGALLNRMARQDVQVVPVLQGQRLIGILTRSNIIALLLRGAEGRSG